MSEVITRRNLSHKAFFVDKERWCISYGGAGSAKSYSTAQKIIDRIITETSPLMEHRILVTRKVAKTLRVSVFQLFRDVISSQGLYEDFKINKTDMTITFMRNNNQIMFMGMDDPEKLKSIQGVTSIWCEEASEMEKGDILELNRRLRGETPYYKQIILTFNPISHLHWLKEHFFDNPASTASIYKTTYKDNKFIDEEYKAELEDIKNYDIQQYNIYALGDWGVLNNNLVYHNFNPSKHTTKLTIDDFEVLHCGVDFNVGGSVCVICGIRDNKLYVVDGWAVHDTQQIADKLTGKKYEDKIKIVYPDASGGNESANASRSSIQILKDSGLRIDAPSANPPVRDRVNTVNRMFARDQIFINDRLERLMYSLQVQAYLDNGKPEKFVEHKGGAVDDWNDALGYLCNRKFAITKVRYNVTKNILR